MSIKNYFWKNAINPTDLFLFKHQAFSFFYSNKKKNPEKMPKHPFPVTTRSVDHWNEDLCLCRATYPIAHPEREDIPIPENSIPIQTNLNGFQQVRFRFNNDPRGLSNQFGPVSRTGIFYAIINAVFNEQYIATNGATMTIATGENSTETIDVDYSAATNTGRATFSTSISGAL